MKRSWKYASLGLILIMSLMLASCSTPAIHAEPAQQTSSMKSILILPFHDVSGYYESNINVRCYLCGQVMTTGYVPESAGPFLTSELVSLMEKKQQYTILSSDGSQDMLTGMMSNTDNSQAQDLNLYVSAGKRVGADAVLIGHIFRFIERKGNRASVESPASVAFDLHLILVDSGAIVWTGHLDQTQRPLSDNLMELGTFIRRGASWITAEELALGGLEDMLRRFSLP
jgi:PBP1b-binding outer membrane lipoprotein LpoB